MPLARIQLKYVVGINMFMSVTVITHTVHKLRYFADQSKATTFILLCFACLPSTNVCTLNSEKRWVNKRVSVYIPVHTYGTSLTGLIERS